MAETNSNHNKRKNIRYVSEVNELVGMMRGQDESDFREEIVGILVDESFKGCSVVIHCSHQLAAGEKMIVRAGKLSPLPAEVRWSKDIDEKVCKVGLEYLK